MVCCVTMSIVVKYFTFTHSWSWGFLYLVSTVPLIIWPLILNSSKCVVSQVVFFFFLTCNRYHIFFFFFYLRSFQTVNIQLPEKVTTEGSTCDSSSSSSVLKLNFGEGHSLSMNFSKDVNKYTADFITFSYNLSDSSVFPDSVSNGKKNTTENFNCPQLWPANFTNFIFFRNQVCECQDWDYKHRCGHLLLLYEQWPDWGRSGQHDTVECPHAGVCGQWQQKRESWVQTQYVQLQLQSRRWEETPNDQTGVWNTAILSHMVGKSL